MRNDYISKKKKYRKEDIEKFIFHGKPGDENLSTTYKDYLYGDKSKWGKN